MGIAQSAIVFNPDATMGMASGHPHRHEPIGSTQLHGANVLSLQTLRSLDNFELNRLAFCQRTEARRLYCSVVNEYITTTVCTADKTKTLSVVEPLNCSLFHDLFLVKTICTDERNLEVMR